MERIIQRSPELLSVTCSFTFLLTYKINDIKINHANFFICVEKKKYSLCAIHNNSCKCDVWSIVYGSNLYI